MAILKCKMCGGELTFEPNITVCECEYCGSKQTIPVVDDEKKITLYERANRLRFNCEFDKAASVYESIVADFHEEAEAYWGLVLCKYGIEYVDDPATGKKIPTCHRSSFDTVMHDADFEMVMENADSISRQVYREQAKEIEELRKGIIEVSEKEQPYDIFICYKETAEDGQRTIDSVLAQDVYEALTDKGYRVFFSRITLEDKIGTEYEPYIFAALNSAKVMLAFGTTYDYYNAVWVKNEWSRYLKLMAKDKSKHLIPCYKNIDAYDIPQEFARLQAQDLGKVGATQDLIRGVEKLLKPAFLDKSIASGQNIHEAVASAVAASMGNNVNSLIERGFMTLEDGDFEKADSLFEDVLNQLPRCAEAYLGKLLVYYKVRDIKDFVNLMVETICAEKETLSISFKGNLRKLIDDNYIRADDIDEDDVERIKNGLTCKYESRMTSISKCLEQDDCIAYFCKLNNDGKTSNEMDDKYYSRFLQYASDELKFKYNINEMIKSSLLAKMKDEKDYKHLMSDEGIIELIEQANENIKALYGDEYKKIETQYQKDLEDWQKKEDQKLQDWQSICENIRNEWPDKKAELQRSLEEWNRTNEELNREYEKKYEEYSKEKATIDAYNASIRKQLDLENQKYASDLSALENSISEKNAELERSKGFFHKKKREELQIEITNLTQKKSALLEPKKYEDVCKKLPDEPIKPVFGKKPSVPSEPVYPTKPKEAPKPVRMEGNASIDAVDVLVDAFRDKGFGIKDRRETIRFGNMNGKPIEWIVLKKDKNKALLLSKYALLLKPYNDEDEEITWEKCTLRKYLNEKFYNEVFSEKERNKIRDTTVINSDNKKYGITGGNNTVDRIFLLSIDEAYYYFETDEDRVTYTLKESVDSGLFNAWVDDEEDKENIMEDYLNKVCWWWLRSPGEYDFNAAGVFYDGSVYEGGDLVSSGSEAVRPALWVDISNLKS